MVTLQSPSLGSPDHSAHTHPAVAAAALAAARAGHLPHLPLLDHGQPRVSRPGPAGVLYQDVGSGPRPRLRLLFLEIVLIRGLVGRGLGGQELVAAVLGFLAVSLL